MCATNSISTADDMLKTELRAALNDLMLSFKAACLQTSGSLGQRVDDPKHGHLPGSTLNAAGACFAQQAR